MNFFVFPHEIQKINKRGGGGGGSNKLQWVSKNNEKNKRPPHL